MPIVKKMHLILPHKFKISALLHLHSKKQKCLVLINMQLIQITVCVTTCSPISTLIQPHSVSSNAVLLKFLYSLANFCWSSVQIKYSQRKNLLDASFPFVSNYSKACLKWTCPKADIWLEWTKNLAPAVFESNSYKITSIKRTL